MKIEDITNAIFAIDPNAQFVLTETDVEGIEWHTQPIDTNEIYAMMEQLPILAAAKEEEKQAKRAALLDRLGITEEEAQLLLSQ